jgi:hypothetical protein
MYREEAMLPKEIKHQSLRATIERIACPCEAEDKDLLESDRLKAVTNPKMYQEETRAWRDMKVKPKQFEDGNLVLLWNPHMENTTKFEAKWTGPYVISEKTRPSAYKQ